MTAHEMDRFRNKAQKKHHEAANYNVTFSGDIPESVNWVDQGVVSPVDNLFLCAAGWSFAAAGVIESSHAINTGKLTRLSAQQCVDCDRELGENWDNCDGGDADDCLYYGQTNPLNTYDDFPYIHDEQTCSEEKTKGPVTVTSINHVQYKSQKDLMAAIAKQPIIVMVDSYSDPFRFYHGGIITEGCGTANDEYILAVGYGKADDGTPYYLAKHNLGLDWGEEGYVRIANNDEKGWGVCGIQANPMYADTEPTK